ncbi:peptidylprolyl isomerase [Aquimarina addita]|uniref:Peptidylprolyl isomerase n=1 Tax=Aquimarina addita TaxID=870485 RepID=A0ABP7X8S2_9FLAO
MHKKIIALFLGVVFCSLVNAQEKDQVLLTINDSQVYTSEFKRVYLKNIDLVKDESQKNIDEYLELFINYKLKLEEATALGLDKKESYIKELKGYEKQLSSGYLTDNQASDALVKEVYDRLQERVNASHILIQVKPNAAPKDTLAAYQKIMKARDQIMGGEDFGLVARRYSEDPSVETNQGDLGWFSAFRMVYPFEDAAFTTEIGEISKPFKTRFGYHILKVNKKEKTFGDITVAHIMVAFNKERTEKEAEDRIREIDIQLKQSVAFESLAKQFSDDKNTALKGGEINRFGQGALNSEEFEKVAFALESPGDISEPVKTKYGWHIIKLIEKHPKKTFEELKGELTKRIMKDERSQIISASFIDKLKDTYGIQKNEEAIQYFKKIIPDTIFEKGWDIPLNDPVLKKNIFVIGKQAYSFTDFAEFLKEKGNKNRNFTDVSIFVEKMYERFESKELLQYYEAHLEEDNEEFAHVISEYRNGLLLFDLMESKIWNAAKTDSIGLKEFYESRKESYVKGETYKVIKASSSNQKLIDKVRKGLEEGMVLNDIKTNVNVSKEDVVIFSEEELVKGEDTEVAKFSGEKDQIVEMKEDEYIILIKVKEVLPSRLKTFEETKGKVINDFQENLEKTWLTKLKNKYKVEVNRKTLKQIKKELSI